jgi:hypothetical protein
MVGIQGQGQSEPGGTRKAFDTLKMRRGVVTGGDGKFRPGGMARPIMEFSLLSAEIGGWSIGQEKAPTGEDHDFARSVSTIPSAPTLCHVAGSLHRLHEIKERQLGTSWAHPLKNCFGWIA